MKILLTVICLLFSSSTLAGGTFRYWNCMQIVQQGKAIVMVLSNINDYPWHNYKARERAFAKQVSKKFNLSSTYSPMCQDFKTRKEAQEVEKNMHEKAKNHKLKVIQMDFKYRGKHDHQEQNK